MSTASQPPTPDHHGGAPVLRPAPPMPPPLPTPRRPWSVGEIAAWVVILLMAAFGATLAIVEQRSAVDSAEGNPGFTADSKIAVGSHELTTTWNPAKASGTSDPFIDRLDKTAKSPGDRLRLAIVSAALEGKDQALERLRAIGTKDDDLLSDAATARDLLTNEDVGAKRWQEFHDQYDWFADLARTVNRPPEDPDRQLVFKSAMQTVAIAAAVMLLLGVMVTIGLILMIAGIVLWSSGRLRSAFRREDPDLPAAIADRSTYAQGVAWYLFILLALALALAFVLLRVLHWSSTSVIAVEMAAQFTGVLCGLLWPRHMGQTFAQWRAALGLHRGRGILREMTAGILGYLAGVPIMALGVIISYILAQLTDITPTHPVNNMLTRSTGWILAAFVMASIWAPITEELMFRGALFAHLRERYGWWISAPIVGFIFAIIHPQGWVALPTLGAIGFVFCGIREWRGSIIGCMTAHAAHNSAALVVAVLLLR